jgi:Ca2+-binding RTX toxin-like protein
VGDVTTQLVLYGTPFDDRINGTPNDDIIDGRGGTDIIHGWDGNDIIVTGRCGQGFSVLDGGAGNDWLRPGIGAAELYGGDGFDTVSYEFASARLIMDLRDPSSTRGAAAGHSYFGIEEFDLTSYDDYFWGNDADTAVIVRGGTGNDTLIGGGANETFFGDSGDDFLAGGNGKDWVDGGAGNDPMVRGGAGDDTLVGGLGGDFLVGDAGADIFKYSALEDSQNILINGLLQQDQIADFVQGQDKIDLSAIDSDPGLPGNQAFVFIADPAHYTGNWTGVVCQITWADGTASICASTDADSECEFIIYMSHPYQFTASDFIL